MRLCKRSSARSAASGKRGLSEREDQPPTDPGPEQGWQRYEIAFLVMMGLLVAAVIAVIMGLA
jgi:hypothetical protein